MENLISGKPYKQWCKARGIDFRNHISKFPFVCTRLGLRFNPIKPEAIKIVKTGFWNRLIEFIKKIFGELSPQRAT